MINGLGLINSVVPYSKYFDPDGKALSSLPKEKRDAIFKEEQAEPEEGFFSDSEAATFAILFSNVMCSLPENSKCYSHGFCVFRKCPNLPYLPNLSAEMLKRLDDQVSSCLSLICSVNSLIESIYELEDKHGFRVKSFMALLFHNFSSNAITDADRYKKEAITPQQKAKFAKVHEKNPHSNAPLGRFGATSFDLMRYHYASLAYYTASYIKYLNDHSLTLPSQDTITDEFLPISVLDKIMDGVNYDKKQGEGASSIGGLEIDWGAALAEEKVLQAGADLVKSEENSNTGGASLTTNPADNNNLHTRQSQENIPAEEHISKRKIALQVAIVVVTFASAVACAVLYYTTQNALLFVGCTLCGAVSSLFCHSAVVDCIQVCRDDGGSSAPRLGPGTSR